MRRRFSWVLVVGASITCRSSAATGAGPGPLEQVVRLSPVSPATNEVLTIHSTLVNRGATAVDVVSRTCGLDAAGDLDLSGSLLMCAAFSRRVTLMPADSVSAFDACAVTSGPGRYTLRVRQALDPERWVEVPVVIE